MLRNLISAALAASLAVCGTPLLAQAAAGTSAGDNAASQPTGGGAATVVVLLPVQQAGTQLGNGCWVRFYDGLNYSGTTLTLVGPVDMPRMEVPGSLWRDWDSAVVGPRATVTTFDNENYRDRTARLNPGAHIADLHASKLGWFDEVHSAKVNCA